MKRKERFVLAVILVVALIAALSIRGILSNSQANLSQLADEKLEDISLTRLADGDYFGSYKAFPISVKVKVTVKNHSISDIELLKHFNGQGSAAEVIPGKVVEAQSLNVDTVAGATYSSKVILKAIEDALRDLDR